MTTTATSLLDEVLPAFDVRSYHERRVLAPAERVADALEAYRIRGPAALLFRLRGIRLPEGSIRDVLARVGFAVVAERPGREVVAAVNGRFWAFDEVAALEAPGDLESFRSFDRPGWAQAAISVRIDPLDDGTTLLSTQTRVRSLDPEARRRFAVYWGLIRFFSGWLRRDFLRSVARTAEAVR